MPRRGFFALLSAFALLLAACQAQPDQAEEEQPEQEPVRGGRLVVALSSDPGHLNPAVTTSGTVHFASEILYNGLIELDDNLEPRGELAESWEVEDDGATYRLTLRDGVNWHDGEPFTSEDVKFTFEQVLLKFHSRTAASVGEALDTVETPDERTVVFRFKHPYAPFLQQLDVTEAPMLPQHVFEEGDPLEHPANTEPVGTGPFRFVSYRPDSEIRYERNPDYFKDDLPYLDEVVMRIMPESASQVVALEAGDVQWLWRAPGPDLERLRGDENVEVLSTNRGPGGSNCVMTTSFNLERAMFEDVDVRRAIALALDRSQFLERAAFEAGRVPDAPISEGIPWAHADGIEMPAFDREQAQQLLEEAGWQREGDGVRTARGVSGVRDGTRLAFDFLHFPDFAPYGELFRAQLRDIGADVSLKPLEPPVFAEEVFTNRNFDTNIISYCQGLDPDVGVRRMYDSAHIGDVPFSNSSAYRNDRVDQLFEEAQQTLDESERAEAYREIQQIVVRDLPYYWMVGTEFNPVHRTECQGFRPYSLFAEQAFCRR